MHKPGLIFSTDATLRASLRNNHADRTFVAHFLLSCSVRLVNTKAHAIVDYALGVVLLLSGWLFQFRGMHPANDVSLVAGSIALVNAALTRFEFGAVQVLPLRVHIAVDIVAGLLLAASPWLFGFAYQTHKAHLVFGLTQAGVGFFSDRILWKELKQRT